jgi:poly(3-hydroxybutyrate) depolymerase
MTIISATSLFTYLRNCANETEAWCFALHDGGESPESMARMTRRNFNKLAEKNNFIVGYPEALNEYWNDAREDSVSLSHYDEIDDVGFIEKVMDYAIDSFKN